MFDAVNGITLQRLEESLRVIYSLDVYQDYNDASNLSTNILTRVLLIQRV